MKPTNYTERSTSTTKFFPDKVRSKKVVKSEGPSYGKICDGAGNFKLSYEGENPIKGYFIASCISVARFVLKLSAVTAVPIIVTWSLKKLGISKETNNLSPKEVIPCNPNTDSTLQIPIPRIGTLYDDVRRAAEQGRPENILTTEIHKDSRLIIFSGPGVGKSILVGQLCIGIGSGKPCGVFPDEVESTPQNVLLIDTEQEDTDLNIRYADGANEIPKTIERVSDCNFNSPEEVIAFINSRISPWTSDGTVIIDNITSAFSLQSGERIRIFFNQLKGIQNFMKSKGVAISYIIVCHETKSAKGVTLKDIQGSGNLGNFATAVYGLEKVDEDLMKLKVLKNRRGSNVGISYLEKLYKEPFFHFELQRVLHSSESDNEAEAPHTTSSDNQTKNPNGRKLSDAQIDEMRELYKTGQKTINQLHEKFGVNNRTVRKYLGLKH